MFEVFIAGAWKVLALLILAFIALGAILTIWAFKKDTDREIEVSFFGMSLRLGEKKEKEKKSS